MYEHIARNLDALRDRITAAAERAGRSPDDVTLVCVTKTRSLDEIRAALDWGVPVLIEVNVAGEESKFGAAADEAVQIAETVSRMPNVDLGGLMTMAPFVEDAESVRRVFRGLRELRDRIRDEHGLALPHLSMGMTQDYEVAVEEGATMVRIGSAVFEE